VPPGDIGLAYEDGGGPEGGGKRLGPGYVPPGAVGEEYEDGGGPEGDAYLPTLGCCPG